MSGAHANRHHHLHRAIPGLARPHRPRRAWLLLALLALLVLAALTGPVML